MMRKEASNKKTSSQGDRDESEIIKHQDYNRKWKARVLMGVIWIIILVGTVGTGELIAEYKLPVQYRYTGTERFIRLREHVPLTDWSYFLTDINHADTDSLPQRVYELSVDDNGFIMPSKRHLDPDIEVVFLGGSTTECIYIDENKRFSNLTALNLERDHTVKVNAYNGGVSGNNTLHSLNNLINKVVPMKPDIVVLMHNINDWSIMLHSGSLWKAHDSRSPLVNDGVDRNIKSILTRFKNKYVPHLYHSIKSISASSQDEFFSARENKNIYSVEEFVTEFEQNLEIFIQICRAKGVRPVLMTQANRFLGTPDNFILGLLKKLDLPYDYKDLKLLQDQFNETIRSASLKHDVILVDLAKDIPQNKRYLYDFVHLNEAGSILAAEIISKKLSPFL